MATVLNFLLALLFLSLAGQGYGQCTIEQLTISQAQTGQTVENKPEWQVAINNGCVCTQSELKLSCNGFQTAEAIDSSVLAISGGECLINDGQPVAPLANFTFNYAWDASFPFKPLSSEINCS